VPVKWIDEVLDLALERPLAAVQATASAAKDGGEAILPGKAGKATPPADVKH